MAAAHAYGSESPGLLGRLWYRDLDAYPKTGPRYWYLSIVVVTTVILYYQLYIGGAVATQILGGYHMTFLYYVGILVVGNSIGAFASLATGAADRFGRANLVVYGTVITSLLTLIGVPHAHSKLAFGVLYSCVALVEGVILVATPALVRDFSPQVGRAAAMGFWTMGPVLGSLVVSEVSSHTLNHLNAWQDQYIIAGVVGLVVAAVAMVGLRELNAGIRDQVMISLQERTVIELRARGLDVNEATRRPYAQMFKPDIIGSAIAISVFLTGYYTAVAFFPIYFQTVLNFTSSQSNDLLNWYWSFNAIALIFFGAMSDRLAVRKPFMLVGALGSILVSITFLSKATHNSPTFSSVAILLAFTGIWGGAAFAPWMASFTETVERRNPALTATGLAVWGWVLRIIVAILFLILPHVVNSVTPLVDNGTQVKAVDAQLNAKYPQLGAELTAYPNIFAQLAKYPNTNAIPTSVLNHAIDTVGTTALTQASSPGAKPLLAYLSAHAPKVQAAQKAAPHQWQHWLWVCTGGQVVFIPFIFLMAGFWRPREAQEDIQRRENLALSGAGPVPDAQPA
ncbi:MAG TPA: MFS transporter [Mycobacteriales bacterium]|nr:MFS transporter [Mycobacteriales bacterium]